MVDPASGSKIPNPVNCVGFISRKPAGRFKAIPDAINCVAMSQDGRLAVSGSRVRTLKVWDLDSGLELQTIEGHLEMVSAVTVRRKVSERAYKSS